MFTKIAFRILAVASFVLIIVIGSTGYGGVEQSNLVENGGFEFNMESKDDPAHWNATRVPQMKDFVVLQWDNDVFHSGDKSVSIAVAKDHPSTKIHYHWNQAPLNCIPGLTYEISGWIKTQELNKSASILVQCWSRGMKKVLEMADTAKTTKILGTSDWTEAKTTIKIPEGTWRVVILAGILGHANPGGKVWFDDVSIILVPED